MFEKRKRAQVTIFIIVAILVVAIVALVVILIRNSDKPSTEISGADVTNPDGYISTCMKDDVYEDIETLSLQGGYFDNPLSVSFKFGDEEYRNISYLCYENEAGVPCVVQQPSIINRMEKELESSLSEVSKNCFDKLLLSIEKDGYTSNGMYDEMKADIQEGRVIIEIDSELTYSKGEQSYAVDKIVFEYPTEIYGIGKTVQRIVSDEMRMSSFDRIDYMNKHPQYNINLYKTADLTKIYTIEDEDSNEKFRFATKGGLY